MQNLREITREERFIENQIDQLENEIERMRSTEVQNQFRLEALAFDSGDGLYNDSRDLAHVIDIYEGVFKHVLKNVSQYEKSVPKDRLTRYFELMKELDVQINRFDPDYPLLS